MLDNINTRLKILGWVKLTCRFKSGPGHQVHAQRGFYVNQSKSKTQFVNSHKEAARGISDATVTPLFPGLIA